MFVDKAETPAISDSMARRLPLVAFLGRDCWTGRLPTVVLPSVLVEAFPLLGRALLLAEVLHLLVGVLPLVLATVHQSNPGLSPWPRVLLSPLSRLLLLLLPRCLLFNSPFLHLCCELQFLCLLLQLQHLLLNLCLLLQCSGLYHQRCSLGCDTCSRTLFTLLR